MNYESFLFGVLAGGLFFGLVAFVFGCVFGVQVGKVDSMKKVFNEISKGMLSRLRQGEVFSAGCHFTLQSTDGDEGDDDEEVAEGPDIFSRSSLNN